MNRTQYSDEGWYPLPDEMTELALRQDGLDGMLATIKRLHQIVATVSLSESERQVLLSQLGYMQWYLQEAVNSLVADRFTRMN